MTKAVFRALLPAVLLSTLCVAQLDRGTITGTVTDPSGAVVPNAKITIKNTATNATYQTVSTGAGDYTAANLPTGAYDLTFEATGLKNMVRSGVVVSVSETIRVDVSLEVGGATETVTVTTNAAPLQTDSAVVGQVVQNRQVNELPLTFGSGGRDIESFAIQLAPGVAGSASGTEINGTPQFSKEVLVDGATATGYRSGDAYQQSPSPEAVQEFKTETSGMSAEYGRTSGGLFNFVMKSGTNQVHGSAMFEFRNQDLDANTFLAISTTRPGLSTASLMEADRSAVRSGFRKYTTGRTRPSSTSRSNDSIPRAAPRAAGTKRCRLRAG